MPAVVFQYMAPADPAANPGDGGRIVGKCGSSIMPPDLTRCYISGYDCYPDGRLRGGN